MQIESDAIRAPRRTPETDEFWDAANGNRLLYAMCTSCETPHFYPRRICPFCFSDAVQWRDASGRGAIYAFSLYRRGRPPYVSAWVMLEEGVAVLTNITDCESDTLAIGSPVKLVFKEAEGGQRVPAFAPE